METAALFISTANTLSAYRRERFPAGIFLPLAVALAGAAVLASGPVSALAFALHVLLAGSLLFQFRLWDDLADRAHDRVTHPDRVLVRSESVAPFRLLLLVSAAGNLFALLLWHGLAIQLVVLLGLNAAGCVWYRLLRPWLPGPILGYHVVLLKYPAFVFLLGTPAPALPLAMVLVYLGLCVYEVLHDGRLRAVPGARAALAVETVALLACCVWLSFRGTPT